MIERCQSHQIKVYGTAAKPYTVTMKMQSEGRRSESVGESLRPYCTCPAFAIGKNRSISNRPGVKAGEPWCKHLEAQFDNLCMWQGEPLISGRCDACSGPTEPVTQDANV